MAFVGSGPRTTLVTNDVIMSNMTYMSIKSVAVAEKSHVPPAFEVHEENFIPF